MPAALRRALREYPRISDTASLLNYLVHDVLHMTFCNARCATSSSAACRDHYDRRFDTISLFQRTYLAGVSGPVYIIECRHSNEFAPLACYPYKRQFIVREDGGFIGATSQKYGDTIGPYLAVREIGLFPVRRGSDTSILHVVWMTQHLHGCHNLLRVEGDTLTQILSTSLGSSPAPILSTAGLFAHDEYYHEPETMLTSVIDANRDGWNDLVLTSRGVQGVPWEKKVPGQRTVKMRFVFLYHPESGTFLPADDYERTYAFMKPVWMN